MIQEIAYPKHQTETPIQQFQEQGLQPQPGGLTWHASASFICGILACVLNGLLIPAPVGFILGILAVTFALIGRRKHKNSQPGLLLGGLSLLILLIYVLSIVSILMYDPAFSL